MRITRTDYVTRAPKASHAAPVRHVDVSQKHAGQIVVPDVQAWHKGKGYVVLLSWYDSSDQTYSEPMEFVGAFWECVQWLRSQGVLADIDAA